MVPPDAPRQHSQATSTHPRLSAKSARQWRQWLNPSGYHARGHSQIPLENRSCAHVPGLVPLVAAMGLVWLLCGCCGGCEYGSF
tara:strand:+ start:159 stop:410 length:252 start_codon:yes stop_codon:yes gene_type:complete